MLSEELLPATERWNRAMPLVMRSAQRNDDAMKSSEVSWSPSSKVRSSRRVNVQVSWSSLISQLSNMLLWKAPTVSSLSGNS